MTRLKATASGVAVTFESAEVAALRDLARQLAEVLGGGVPDHGTDAVRDRLFPRAYVDPTEDRAEDDFQSVVHDDLVQGKSDAIRALVAALDAGRERRGRVEVVLASAALEQWVGAMNDVRLALGVTLGVTEDSSDDVDVRSDDDPRSLGLAMYDWLTYLQGALVDVLLADLGDEA